MGKRLAIKGHLTRGKEVIKLLEMMGGTNPFSINDGAVIGNKETNCYYVSETTGTKYISWVYIGPEEINKFIIFTLEEFLDKYPFKVGDKVLIPEYESEVRICKMRWEPLCNYVEYMVYRNEDQEWYTTEELLNYNDIPTECLDIDCHTNNIIKSLDDVYSIAKCKTIGQGTYAIKIADDYKFDSIDENGNIIVKSIKSKYPTNYEECCDAMYGNVANIYGTCIVKTNDGYKGSLIQSFQRLIFYRDTYRKIYSDQMCLDKPWEPDWSDFQTKYGISYYKCTLTRNDYVNTNKLLCFPTAEMRDAFYENFKDLIEQCKELL